MENLRNYDSNCVTCSRGTDYYVVWCFLTDSLDGYSREILCLVVGVTGVCHQDVTHPLCYSFYNSFWGGTYQLSLFFICFSCMQKNKNDRKTIATSIYFNIFCMEHGTFMAGVSLLILKRKRSNLWPKKRMFLCNLCILRERAGFIGKSGKIYKHNNNLLITTCYGCGNNFGIFFHSL